MTRDDRAATSRTGGRLTPRPGLLVVAGGVAVCLLLVVAVLLGSRGPGPLDQPDAAQQRDGLVLDGPTVSPTVAGVHLRSLPNVLLFVREPPDGDVLDGWRRSLPPASQVSVVVQGPAPADDAAAGSRGDSLGGDTDLVSVVQDPEGRLAAAVGLPRPVDGGPGVGYAVVDADGVVRYSTLDPAWADNAFEVATIVGATS